jgi:hypothetical protein
MLLARCAAALGLLVVFVGVLGGGGCGITSDDCGGCTDAASVLFYLSCSPNDLTSVVTSGPCSMPDASLEWYTGGGTKWVAVGSPSPGECHIVLTFATGFTYSADVTFTSQTGGQCPGCRSYIGPTSGPFTVNNPNTTCLDAGPDAGASGA